VVLLGLKGNENNFVDKNGKWLADYIPAYVRRYPFILASNEDNGGSNFAVCIDESYPGFNTKKKGQQLFDDNGEESETLKQSVEFLREYQNHIQLTALFCNNINDLGLLEPMQANIELKDGEKHSMGGFMGVNRTRLKELPAETLADLVKSDQIELIYAHLNSLNNINTLMERLN
ncbi:MAG: SapC family protein, partial [Gammaproteobacteria bacterium]